MHKIEVSQSKLPDLEHPIVLETTWQALLERASSRCQAENTSAEDPAFIVYTSGTAGTPKGAVHGHRARLGHLPGFELSHDFYGQPADRFWTRADWAWSGGLYDAVSPVLYHRSTILGNEALRADIQDFVSTRVAAYLYPRHIGFIEEMLLTRTGKIRRNELRTRHVREKAVVERRRRDPPLDS